MTAAQPGRAPQPEDNHPLVTDGMRRHRGVWGSWGRWSAPIRDSDIRRWAIAVYWPESLPRRFWDEAYARGTKWRGMVAPDEFNPFAWPASTTSTPAPRDEPDWRPDPEATRRRVNGGCQARYGQPMRPGDRIRRRVRLGGWHTKRGSAASLLLVDFEHEWRNQHDLLVREAVFTLIYS